MDGNLKRACHVCFRLEVPVEHVPVLRKFKAVSDRLIDRKTPGIFNQAIMELGALKCTPKKPDCRTCPIKSFCRAHQAGAVSEYPKRVKLPPTPEVHIAVGVVYRNSLVLITRRKSEGLLGGLWEFPGGKVKKDESAETACVREIREEVNLSVEIASFLTRVRHAYTHFKVCMDVFCCKYLSGDVQLKGPVDYQWIELNEIKQYPFPKANHKFIPFLKETRCPL